MVTAEIPLFPRAQPEEHWRPAKRPVLAARASRTVASASVVPMADLAGVQTRTPAVVLKLDPNVMHHGGLGVIRSLGRLGVPVYALQESRWAPAASSRFLHGLYFWTPSPADTGRLREGLLRLADRIGGAAVLLATDDAGAIFLAEHGAGLRSSFLFPAPPDDLPRRLAGKYSLYQLCRELGVPAPAASVAGSEPAAREFAAGAGYPLIAKLATPWRHGSGELRSTTIVASEDELTAVWRAAVRGGAGLMLQEFIPGGRGCDWFFHGYCDARSVCSPAFTGVKERSYPARAGLTSFGRSAPNPRLRDEITAMLARLRYRGILDLDLRFDARDGQYKLLDFNPRLGAQFRLFRDTAGVDVALAQYIDLTGGVIPAGEQVDDRRFLVENYDPISALGYWRSGELSLLPWLASLRAVDETAWFARDDLRPFGLMCVRMGWRLATRPLARRGAVAGQGEPRYVPGRASGRATQDGSSPSPPGQRARHATPPDELRGANGMSDAVDVVIVGAGPYGLSLAAHLRARGARFRHFGLPMQLWRTAMPNGMFLKSQGFASSLSSPDGKHTLEAFCREAGRPYASYGLPVPLATFVAYGEWFRQELLPDLEQTLVTEVVPKDGHYEVSLASGDRIQAGQVVVAAGVEHFAVMPEQLAQLPPSSCTHSSAHANLGAFRGQSVIVLGAGQSALETAALLHESGGSVQLAARRPRLVWNGKPLPPGRPLLQRMREPEAGLGSGWSTWFYSRHPELFRHLPEGSRVYRARTALGPAGASWLPDRVNGQFPVHLGHALKWAKADGNGVVLGLAGPGGTIRELAADHVIAATGYRADLHRLTFLSDQLRPGLRTVAQTAAVDRHYRSSVPGLYFIGPAVAPTFGPVMRFVYGSDHAARTVARQLAG